MTTRTDVAVNFNPSPRIAEVAAPSVEFDAQDVVDTLRIAEYQFEATTHKKLLNATGKEDLGSGRFVGITATLQNTLVAFAARKTPAETGSVTTPSGAPVGSPLYLEFTDTAADFITALVQPGSFIVNWTDRSCADVLAVIDADTIRTTVPENGIGNTWDAADLYSIWNIVQCNAGGGNLVAVDTDGITPISPILPTAFTQVILERDSSAVIVNADVGTFWDALLSDHVVAGSFGEWVGKKLLSVVKFLGLK